MRVWDVDPKILCRNHLLGEHREIHAIWSVIVNGRSGYARHPETLRWVGRLRALHNRHRRVVAEMEKRGYNHASPLDCDLATGDGTQDVFIDSPQRQLDILREKGCGCRIADSPPVDSDG